MISGTLKQTLLGQVRQAIDYGLENHKIMPVTVTEFPSELQKQGASFVTLEIQGALRGCIGTLEAYQPLIENVVYNGYAAAFSDPRFQPLTSAEWAITVIYVSILSQPESMQFSSEQDLISQLKPGKDGIILSDIGHRGTFLPSVWEQLPDPKQFLKHLKKKAGFASDYWSDTLQIQRYTTEIFSSETR